LHFDAIFTDLGKLATNAMDACKTYFVFVVFIPWQVPPTFKQLQNQVKYTTNFMFME
jgi:hypothetical protein